jgi:zinc/manganese transport system substrate-binding protein
MLLLLLFGVGCAMAPSPASTAQSSCTLDAHFAQLQQHIPDIIGICQSDVVQHPELAELAQQTSNGQLTYRSLDNVSTFSDGAHAWVLDATGQVQTRAADQRFPFEFNPDDFPLVGEPEPSINGACPTPTVHVLAVENFYADLVNQIGGQCVITTTILSDPDADPHEYQPAASDVRAYQSAQLVVENGLGYDDFSDRILATLSAQPELIRVGDVLGLQTGTNPHVWYSASAVARVRGVILTRLEQLEPGAAVYFDAQAATLDQRFSTYAGLSDQIHSQFAGTAVGATESIAQYAADSTGLNLVTPREFMDAMAEGNEPSARDIALFQDQVRNRRIRVLIYNTQTVTTLTEQLKTMAEQNGIPLVGVSETMPDGVQTFEGWQATELALLLRALQQS